MGRNVSFTSLSEPIPSMEVTPEYIHALLVSFGILLTVVSCYNSYYRRTFSHFPSSSVELWCLYVIGTRRFMRELSTTKIIFTTILCACKQFEKEGICIMWFFKPLFCVFGEEYIKVFANEHSVTDRPLFYSIISDFLGNGILTHNVPLWKKRRKMFLPCFRFEGLRDMIPALNHGAQDIVNKLTEQSNKPTVETLRILKVGVLKMFIESFIGLKMNDKMHEEKLSDYVSTISSLGDYTVNRFARPYLWWKRSLLLFEDGRNILKMRQDLRNFIKELVQEIMKAKSNPGINTGVKEGVHNNYKSLSSILLDNYANDPEFTMEDLEDELNTFLFGGHDTASYTLLWCLFMLALHPEIQERAFDEVESVMEDNDGFISYSDLGKLRYLESVIKESLRLYPVVPIIARSTTDEVQYGKYKIPKNAIVLFVPYLLHRNPNIYPNPEVFDPERFYKKCLKHPWAYIPFSEGIRNCLGKAFSIMQMKIILANILRKFKITSLDKREDILLDWKIMLTPMTPIRFKFTNR